MSLLIYAYINEHIFIIDLYTHMYMYVRCAQKLRHSCKSKSTKPDIKKACTNLIAVLSKVFTIVLF